MPKNVMKMLKPSPNYGRNDFDLSHRTVYDANFGELIPCMCIETLPKDKIKVRVSDLVRAMPMVTSPFLRAKQHIDVWFVPYQLMWSRFNEFIADKDEPVSSALHDRLYIPTASMDFIQQSIDDWVQQNVTDVHGFSPTNTVARNLDLLGYAGTHMKENAIDSSKCQHPNYALNLWRIAAYNLIWYREYRQQYYDDGKLLLPSSLASLSNGASYLFNFDWMTCSTTSNSDFGDASYTFAQDLMTAMIQPRYRCWKKDIFTGLMPSTQFGNVSLVNSVTDNDLNRWTSVGSVSGVTDSTPITANSNSGNITNLRVNDGNTINSSISHTHLFSFDILALRKSEAIQRWRENALRAGNQVQDNFEAHYGVKPQSHMDVHPKHVASFDAPLNIGDVMAQAQTGQSINGLLGDVAGKGIMSFSGNDEFTFETNDFGVLMGIYSVLPEAEYNGNNIDRMNALIEREDYFFPEYENLGLEAVDMSVISTNKPTTGIIGYAPRYFGYKQKHDRCVGQFQNYQQYQGIYRQWCSPKYDVDDAIKQSLNMPLSCLYVNPQIYAVNFAVGQSLTSQFLVDQYNDVEAIRQMSVSGMPGY